MAFAAVLFFSVYYIGKRWKSEKTGLFAVFIVSMYPYVFGLSKTFLLEFALTALVCFSYCCLLYSENFRHRLYSVLFGISLGIGMLTKPTFILFLIGPLALTVINVFWDHKLGLMRRKAVLNSGIAFIASVAIAGGWYFHNALGLQHELWQRWYLKGKIQGGAQPLYSAIYYLKLLVLDQIGPFFAILSLPGVIHLLKNNQRLRTLSLLLWLTTPYLFLILLNIRYMYYTVPNLPVIALLSSLGILEIKNKYTKRILVFLVIIWALIQYLIISYTSPNSTNLRVSPPTTIKIRNSIWGQGIPYEFSQPCHILPIAEFFYHFPRKGDWRLDDVIRVIEKNNPLHRKSTIGVTDALIGGKKVNWFNPDPRQIGTSWHDNFLVVNNAAVEYFVKSKKLPYKVISLIHIRGDWMNSPLLDFIISVKEIKDIAPAVSGYYELILQTNVPDGSPIYVYKNKSN
jgi:hypothetical protein